MRAMTTVSAALPDDAPHLLVVDDDRRIRDLLSRFLFAEGYRVTTAETAADARAKLAGLRFDLLILDVMMPGETGFDLARADRHADRARRSAEPHRRSEHRRRRLREQAVRAARAFVAHRRHSAARSPGHGSAGGIGALRRVPVPSRARGAQARRGDRAADGSRARHAAPARRHPRRDRAAADARRQRRRDRRARRRRAGQPPAPQDRARSGQPAAGADRARHRLPAGDDAMTSLDVGIAALRSSLTALRASVAGLPSVAALRAAADRGYELYDRSSATLKGMMPTGLYARALLIIIAPMVVLQSVVAYMFMERHYNLVTQRLSAGVVQDIATLIEVDKVFPRDYAQLRRIAQDKLGLVVDFLPVTELPPPGPKPFFSLVDQALSEEVRKQIGRPFWIDTVGRSALLEIRIKLDNAVMRVFAPRRAAYVSNSHIFLAWMVGTSLVLITVAVLFLRNQIRPILRLADAAESFGKGREVPDFRPRGAREVRRAAVAFIE